MGSALSGRQEDTDKPDTDLASFGLKLSRQANRHPCGQSRFAGDAPIPPINERWFLKWRFPGSPWRRGASWICGGRFVQWKRWDLVVLSVVAVSEWALSGTAVSVRLANWWPGRSRGGRMQNQEEQAVLFMLQKQLEGWEKGFTRAQPGPSSVDPCPRRAVNQAPT